MGGAVAIPLRPQFGSWLGWLVPDDRPLIFVLEPGQDASEVVRQARTIGYDRLAGALAGDSDDWRAAGLAVDDRRARRRQAIDRPVLDVRQDNEYAAGHVPGALHVELGDIARPRPRAAGRARPSCAATANGPPPRPASSNATGRTGIAVVIGGPDDWSQHGHRLETGP